MILQQKCVCNKSKHYKATEWQMTYIGVWAKVSNSNSMCGYSLKQALFDVRSDPQSWLLENTKNSKAVVYPQTWDCLYEKIFDPCGRQWQEANESAEFSRLARRSLSRPISKAPPLKAAWRLVWYVPLRNMLLGFSTTTGWWFGTWILWLSIQLGIWSSQLTFTPSFFRGVGLNHQPDNKINRSTELIWHRIPFRIAEHSSPFSQVFPTNQQRADIHCCVAVFNSSRSSGMFFWKDLVGSVGIHHIGRSEGPWGAVPCCDPQFSSNAACSMILSWYIIHNWLVVWNSFYFSIYWEFHHPNCRNHIFQRGGSTTNQFGFQTCLIFHKIWDVILPIDELHHFSRWLKHVKTC